MLSFVKVNKSHFHERIWLFRSQASYHSLWLQRCPATEASALLKTLLLRITLLCMHAQIRVCLRVCSWVAVKDLNMQSASLRWTFFSSVLTFLLFSCTMINPASTRSALPLLHSFLFLVFIKLFLNFVYLSPCLMRFCSPSILFPILLSGCFSPLPLWLVLTLVPQWTSVTL